VLRNIEEARVAGDLRMTKMRVTARERETRPPSVLISEWAVMYCRSRKADRLIISCTQVGAKGGASTAASVCCKREGMKRSAEVNERGVRGRSSKEGELIRLKRE